MIVDISDKIETILGNESKIATIRELINADKIVVLKNQINPDLIRQITGYLAQLSTTTIPNYHAIEAGAPNFYRLNFEDPRAYVKGHFRQLVFFPWNQDLLQFFDVFKSIFWLKNVVAGKPKESFIQSIQEDCTARIAFQFYDSGAGFLNPHKDPVGDHQTVIPSLVMSKKGRDFETGGFYVIDGEKEIDVEPLVDVGDVVLFSGQVPHGVHKIDSGRAFQPLRAQGRWMGLFAVNKLAGNTKIANSQEIKRG